MTQFLADMIKDPSSIVTDFFFVWDGNGRQRAVPKLTLPCDVAGMYLLIDLINVVSIRMPIIGSGVLGVVRIIAKS